MYTWQDWIARTDKIFVSASGIKTNDCIWETSTSETNHFNESNTQCLFEEMMLYLVIFTELDEEMKGLPN